jgi:hypothetical protein
MKVASAHTHLRQSQKELPELSHLQRRYSRLPNETLITKSIASSISTLRP